MEERPFSDTSYRQFLNEEKLMGSRCKKCSTLFFPPRPICIKCYSPRLEWVEMKGRGILRAFTCIYIGPPSMIKQGYNRKNPYYSGVVELEERVRVDARIEGLDTNKPEDIRVGMPLRAKYLHRQTDEGQKKYLAFEPA